MKVGERDFIVVGYGCHADGAVLRCVSVWSGVTVFSVGNWPSTDLVALAPRFLIYAHSGAIRTLASVGAGLCLSTAATLVASILQ